MIHNCKYSASWLLAVDVLTVVVMINIGHRSNDGSQKSNDDHCQE